MDSFVPELQVLLNGLVATLTGDRKAAAALPSDRPSFPRDALVLCAFTLAFFIINWGLRLLLVQPFAKHVVKLKGSQAVKFAQSVMEAIFYGFFAYMGLMVVPSQEWLWPSAQWWIGFAEGGHEVMRADLRCYYISYAARYVQGVVSVLLEPKRKDFVEMLLHHIVTVLVSYISYVHGWNRVGVVVMALLDPADVPLHFAKLCKYTADAGGSRWWQFVADRLFELFAIVFFVTRLVLYGYVCWSAHVESKRYFTRGLPAWSCVLLLETLLCLQIYWFSLIVKVAIRLARGEGAEDPRSDDEAEDDDGKKDQ